MSKILIYEGMDGHGECLHSYYYYFKKLGYDVEFAIKEKVAKENPLWMLSKIKIHTIKPTIHVVDHALEVKKQIPYLFSFDLIFIATMNKNRFKFAQYLMKNGYNKNKILFQNHLNHSYYMIQTDCDKLIANNGFTLGLADHKYFPQLSPIKSIDNFEHNKIDNDFNNELNILISGLSHIHFKNFERLVSATEQLNAEGYNIKLNVTGIREQGNYVLPQSKHVNYLGRLNFKDMAAQYLVNDFLFVLFDTKALMCQQDHDSFLDGRVSGSRNMSIIYKLPLVVQKSFQLAWGLDDSNSISYEGHEYNVILKNLYKLSKDCYNKLIDNLSIKEKEELDLCLNNVKDKLNLLLNTQQAENTSETKNKKKPRFGSKK